MLFTQIFETIYSNLVESERYLSFQSFEAMYISLFTALGVGVLLYVMLGITLYSLGKKAGLTKLWRAFIPFANTYMIGELAVEGKFFKIRTKNIKMIALIAEIIYFLFYTAYLVMYAVAVEKGFINYEIQISEFLGEAIEEVVMIWNLPVAMGAYKTVYNVIKYVSIGAEIFYIIGFWALFLAFFRRYKRNLATLLTLICVIFPALYPIFILTCIKSVPVDYFDFLAKQHMAYDNYIRNLNSMYQNNPSNQNTNNSNPFEDYSQTQTKRPESPFSEYSASNEKVDTSNIKSTEDNSNNDNSDLFD